MKTKSSFRSTLLISLVSLLIATFAVGCDANDTTEVEEGGDRVLIVANGGNFGDQNGSLTQYNLVSKVARSLTTLDAFAQSVTINDGMAYVALNTFTVGRIAIVDVANGAIIRQISDVPAPRSIAITADGILLAPNLSPFGEDGPETSTVSIVQPGGGQPGDEAPRVGLYPEGVVISGGLAYVANSGNLGDGTTLSVVDLSSFSTIGEIELGCDGPNEIFLDADSELVIVCEGKTVFSPDFTEILEQTNAKIIFVNPSTGLVTGRIELDTQAGSGNQTQGAYYSDENEELYVLIDGFDQVLRIDTSTNSLVSIIDVPAAEGLTGLSAVAYDGVGETLYLGRFAAGPGGFPDYTSAGGVVGLDRSGIQVDRFTAGPAPSHIEIAVLIE